MSARVLRIATRKSPLALWQAEEVARRLAEVHSGLSCELVTLSTQGDRILDTPLARIGGKGLFVKELESALLSGEADIAVHSMKDVPVELPAGLHLPVILAREDPRDAFVSRRHARLSELPKGARVGTSSLRRRCQLKATRPDLEVLDLRGNVNTRLRRLDHGDFDAIVLAAAGLIRLGLVERIRHLIAPEDMLPAIGQGAIGIECRQNDDAVLDLLRPIDDADTQARLTAERALNAKMGGSCQIPIAAYAELHRDELFLRALVGDPDGERVLRAQAKAPRSEAASLGVGVAELLIDAGAAEILSPLGFTVARTGPTP